MLTGVDIYLKNDFLQYTGRYFPANKFQVTNHLKIFNFSFKERGARYTLLMLSREQKEKGVITASLGNHAQAVSYHGHTLGIGVTVVMPLVAPIMKIQKCRKYNANVIVEGKDMKEARKIAIRLARQQDYTYING